MDLVSALLGIIIGILGTWISYRNRISPQREILYSKQSDIYANVLNKLQSIYSFTLIYQKASDEEKKLMQEDIHREYLDFINETAAIGVIAPTGVYLAYSDLTAMISGVTNPNDPNYGEPKQTDLIRAYYQFLNSIRRSMGVDSLSEESMGLFRKPKDTREYLDMDFYHEDLKESK